MELEKFFNPKSVAIVGASEEDGKVGNALAKNILELGYDGEVFFVNPKHDELFGRKCFKDLSEITESVDLAIIAIPARFVNQAISSSAGKIKNYVVISAGFSEIGAEGREKEVELGKIAKDNDLNILGPNCLGFIIPRLKLNASFAAGLPKSGNVALISQSGALVVAMMDLADKEGLAFSSIISVGNKMQLDESSLLEYLEKDPETRVIGMYLEGIKDGQRFIEVAQEVSKKKPIVVLKAGKTEKAQKAISSHTGALAGSDEIMEAAFEKAGILRAKNLDNFFGLLEIMSKNDPPENPEVVVITNAGGPGVLTTDAFLGKGLKLGELSDETRKALREFLPEESSVENPIDLLGDAQDDRYSRSFEVIEKTDVGSVICVLTPQAQTPVGRIAREIIAFKKRTKKNVSSIFIGGEKIIKAVDELEGSSIANFQFPDQAVEALEGYYCWKVKRESAVPKEKEELDQERIEKVSSIIRKAKEEERTALLFGEAKEIMEMYGIRTSGFMNASDREKSGEIGFPVVVKVDSDKTLHKTDKQGLVLNIKDPEELEVAVAKISANFPGENIIIQPMLPIKTEMILGIKRDPIFGPVVICGMGGIYTEIFKMVEFFLFPSNMEEIRKKLMGGKLGWLFRETRGQAPYDVDELAQITHVMHQLSREIPEISELDINPLLVYNDKREAVAVDVKIMF